MECFPCFSDDCEGCDGDGCQCSHADIYADPRPAGCTTCSYTRTRYSHAYTLTVEHANDCPNRPTTPPPATTLDSFPEV